MTSHCKHCGIHESDITTIRCINAVHHDFEEKPRTKVEYELIKFESTAGAYRAMLDGEKLYSQDGESEFLFDGKNFVGIDSDGGVYTLECHSNNEPFYRKVERPVEWWEDAAEFIVENDDDDLSAYFDKQSGELRVNTRMKRDGWCDFARILLEQEDENKNNASS